MERCRFCNCMKLREFCENIFDNKQTNPTIPTIVELFTNLKIVEDDPYTKFICFNCFHILIIFYHYREKILETDRLLQNEAFNTNQNNVEDFHKKWPRIARCDDGQFVVYKNNSDDCKTNLQTGSDSEDVENQCLNSLIGDDKNKKNNDDNDKLCSTIKREYDDEDQIIDQNNQHSNVSIDNDATKNCDDDNDNDKNKQLNKNCLYIAESLGFIKYEVDVGELCLKIEKDFNDDEEQNIYENNHLNSQIDHYDDDKTIINDKQISDIKDTDRYYTVIRKDESRIEECPSINVVASNRSIDDDQNKKKVNNNKEKKRLKCKVCDEIFSTKSDLIKHVLIHAKVELHQCNICMKIISSKKYLKRHLLTHTLDKTYQCNICNEKFGREAELKKHSHIHTDVRPYQCNICNKSFKQKGVLKRHLLHHTGEKPYQCDICNNRFSQKAHLKEHLRIHTDETPYQCNFCGKGLKYIKSLKMHLLTHTKTKQHYQCTNCNKLCASIKYLCKHKKKCVKKSMI